MPFTGEVRRSLEPSAKPSAAVDNEERQFCTTCLLAESAGLCLCFLPPCAVHKDNAVGNAVAVVSLSIHHAQGQDLYEEKRSHESFAEKRRKTRVNLLSIATNKVFPGERNPFPFHFAVGVSRADSQLTWTYTCRFWE